MSVLYKPVIDPNPIAHDSGNQYTLAGHIAVSDNENISYMGRNEQDEFQFDVVSSTQPSGDRPFSESVTRVNNEPVAKVVCKKDGEIKGEAVCDFG